MKISGERGVLQQFLLDCESRLINGSLRLYRRQLGVLIGFLTSRGVVEIEEVKIVDLREYIHFLSHSEDNTVLYPDARRRIKRSPGPSTVASHVRVIKAFFSWCVEEELLEKSPALRLAMPKIPKRVIVTLSSAQIDKILASCDVSTVQGFRDYVILVLLLDTGMRVSELVSLRLSNVYSRYVKVLGKGMKEREIGLHPDVSRLLWMYIQKYRDASAWPSEDRVFLGRKGALTTEGIEQVFQRVEVASGIEGVRFSPHTMRHTFSKQYLKNGGDLFKLSRELGHSDVQVTGRVYLGDFHSSDAREDHSTFSPIIDINIIKSKRGEKRQNKK
jgi:integrase/recombinase XerD